MTQLLSTCKWNIDVADRKKITHIVTQTVSGDADICRSVNGDDMMIRLIQITNECVKNLNHMFPCRPAGKVEVQKNINK